MVRRAELPEVGTKYEFETKNGDKIAIVFLLTDKIQLYLLEKSCDEPCVVNLTPEEARRLGSILFGAVFTYERAQEREAVDVSFSALSDLRLSVHTYPVGRNLAGKSIGELAIRKKTGVTVIAVSRGGENIVNPPPSFVFQEGDVLVAMGEWHQLRSFEKEILGI